MKLVAVILLADYCTLMHSPPWWPHKQQSMTLAFLHIECLQKQHYTGNADFCWTLGSNLMLSDYLSSDFQIVWVCDLGKIQKQHSLNREPLEVVSFWRISFENVFRVYNLGSLTECQKSLKFHQKGFLMLLPKVLHLFLMTSATLTFLIPLVYYFLL